MNPTASVLLVGMLNQPEFLEKTLGKYPEFAASFPYLTREFPFLNWHLRFAYFAFAEFELHEKAPELLISFAETSSKTIPDLFPQTVRIGDYVKAPGEVRILGEALKLESRDSTEIIDQVMPLYAITSACMDCRRRMMEQVYQTLKGKFDPAKEVMYQLASDEARLAETTRALAINVCIGYHGMELPEPSFDERVTALCVPISEMARKFKELLNGGFEDIPSLRLAAENGNCNAQCILGAMYFHGDQVPRNHNEALKWYLKAAEQGHPNAQFGVGGVYDLGEGVQKDRDEATKWYLRAAKQGDATAQFHVGLFYYKGERVSKDLVEALKLFRAAAVQGHAEAQLFLGVLYYSGDGVSKDVNEAVKWYRMAAEQGVAIARSTLDLIRVSGVHL